MITTPYNTLREDLQQEEDWQPEWAQRLEVRRQEDTTIYVAQPERIDTVALQELYQLVELGWHLSVDSQRLNRIRISLWR